jgi:Spy/CpxP family protein refolding chaperone
MKKRAVGGLIGLNAALLLCLALVTFAPAVTAQQGPARDPGDYTMVAGEIQGQTFSALYIVDASNQELVAVMWEQNRKKLLPVGYRDLAADGQGNGRAGR